MYIQAHGPARIRVIPDNLNKDYIKIEISDSIRYNFAYMNKAQAGVLIRELQRLINDSEEEKT